MRRPTSTTAPAQAVLGAPRRRGPILRAGAHGPVRILLPAFTGTGDLYWYVKSDSPIKTVADMKGKRFGTGWQGFKQGIPLANAMAVPSTTSSVVSKGR